MASQVGDLAVRVGANVTDFENGMAKAARSVKNFSTNAASQLRKTINTTVKLGAAATAAGTAITAALVVRSGEAAKNLKVLSNISKATTEEFQRLAFGAQQFNVDAEKLGDILKDVNDRVGDFLNTGGGPMADFFDNIAPRVGLTAEAFRNLSGPDALQLYVSSLEKANLSQEDMTFYLEAMASDLTNILPLFKENGKLLKEQGDRAERLGIILSGVDVEQLSAMNRSLETSSKIFDVMGQKLSAELAPYVSELVDQFLNAAEASGGFGDEIEMAISKSIRVAGKLADAIHGLKVVFKGVELIAVSFGAAVTSVIEIWASAWANMSDFAIGNINRVITAFNMLPSVNIDLVDTISDSPFMQGLHAMGESARNQVSTLRTELNNLATQELPSENVENFLNAVKERSIETAAEVNAAVNSMVNPQGENVETDAEKYAKKEQALRDHLSVMYGIQDENYKGIDALANKHWGVAATTTSKAMKSILGTMSTESKKAFEIQKAWALADAVISTAQGIAAGVRLGWPMAIPAVAYAAAQGYAQISQIKSTRFGGGGGSNAGASAAPSQSSTSESSQSSSSSGASVGGTLTVAPIDPNAIFSGSSMQAFGENIYDYTKDGGKVVFAA